MEDWQLERDLNSTSAPEDLLGPTGCTCGKEGAARIGGLCITCSSTSTCTSNYPLSTASALILCRYFFRYDTSRTSRTLLALSHYLLHCIEYFWRNLHLHSVITCCIYLHLTLHSLHTCDQQLRRLLHVHFAYFVCFENYNSIASLLVALQALAFDPFFRYLHLQHQLLACHLQPSHFRCTAIHCQILHVHYYALERQVHYLQLYCNFHYLHLSHTSLQIS